MQKYEGRCEQIIDKAATTVKLVDECRNAWDCVLMFGSTPYEHCKIGGMWKRFVDARKIFEGVRMRFAALVVGNNSTVYVTMNNLF